MLVSGSGGWMFLTFRRHILLLNDKSWRCNNHTWDEKYRSRMSIAWDFKVLDKLWSFCDLWDTISLYLHIFQTVASVCGAHASHLCASAEVSFVHEGPAKFMPLTRLRLHFLIRSALHFNEGASEASVWQVAAQIRSDWPESCSRPVGKKKKSDCEILKIITQMQQAF